MNAEDLTVSGYLGCCLGALEVYGRGERSWLHPYRRAALPMLCAKSNQKHNDHMVSEDDVNPSFSIASAMVNFLKKVRPKAALRNVTGASRST
jgi:hypothetical protein